MLLLVLKGNLHYVACQCLSGTHFRESQEFRFRQQNMRKILTMFTKAPWGPKHNTWIHCLGCRFGSRCVEQNMCKSRVYVCVFSLFFPGDRSSHLHHSDGYERRPLLRHSLPSEIPPPPHPEGGHDSQHLHLDWYILQWPLLSYHCPFSQLGLQTNRDLVLVQAPSCSPAPSWSTSA